MLQAYSIMVLLPSYQQRATSDVAFPKVGIFLSRERIMVVVHSYAVSQELAEFTRAASILRFVPLASTVGRKPYRLPKSSVSQERIHPPWICCSYRGLPILSPKLYTGFDSRLCTNLIYFPTTMRIEEICMEMIMP